MIGVPVVPDKVTDPVPATVLHVPPAVASDKLVVPVVPHIPKLPLILGTALIDTTTLPDIPTAAPPQAKVPDTV